MRAESGAQIGNKRGARKEQAGGLVTQNVRGSQEQERGGGVGEWRMKKGESQEQQEF